MDEEADVEPDLRQVFDDLVRFETVLWAAVDERLRAESGLTLGAFNVLLVVGRTERCRVLDVAQALALTVGGVSQAVDRLESSGRISRRANPDDRRSSILELTAEGRGLVEVASPVFDRELERLLREPLTSGELRGFGGTLQALRRAAAGRA